METVTDFIFLGSKITADAMKLKAPWKKSYDKPRKHIKKQRNYFANKGPSSRSYRRRQWHPTPGLLPGESQGPGSLVGCCLRVAQSLTRLKWLSSSSSSQSYGFSSSHVWTWELDHKESWVPTNCCLWTVVLEKILESPLDSKEIKPVNPKGNQPWIFTERADAEAEVPLLWPPDAKNWLTGKDPDWRQEEKGTTEDEMVGWHHWFYGHEFEQAPGVGDGQGGLMCCSPWGCRLRHDWATELNEVLEQSTWLAI